MLYCIILSMLCNMCTVWVVTEFYTCHPIADYITYCLHVSCLSGVQLPVLENLSQYNQSPRSTQPGRPSVGRHSEYQPKGGDALRLGIIGRYGS